MKKIILLSLTLPCLVFLFGCSKNTESNEISEKENTTSQSSSTKTVDATSSDIEGIASGKLSPEIDGEVVDSLNEYSELKTEEKNELIYDYLVKATLSIGGSEEGAKELLKEHGIESSTVNLNEEFDKIQAENPELEFNELMILIVEKVMTNNE